MKVACDVDSRVPETIRTNSEWRASFRLSSYSHIIRDVRIVVRSPPEDTLVKTVSCIVWVRLGLRDWIIVLSNSESANDSVLLAIDRAAALVVQYVRRRSSEGTTQRSDGQRSIMIVDVPVPSDPSRSPQFSQLDSNTTETDDLDRSQAIR